MRSVFALGIAALTGFTAAQTTPQMNYPYTIDPDTVPQSTRDYWCSQNTAQCPLICLQQPGVNSMSTESNDCDSDNLTYNCVCDNGISPNITEYSQTLPFFICQQWGNNCVDNCGNDSTCQSACRQDHPCGAQEPYRGNTSLPTTMASTAKPSGTASNTIPVTGFGGAEPTGSSGSNSGNNNNNTGAGSLFMPNAGLGLAALFGSVFFGFAVLL
ncbi:hypothetical protein COCSADRAFT_200645 [Bipolaris sorokiniana ND90Pr]|uniref:DUF7707 domain-containing protein n=1 Tax=Cochliobolus sativus (strain ND90Pr / ATCC 201652) TaxID=665912 RepID=M2T1X2_COCSN|nr:uncharacterized protein COCSADRAFT_200645 [Bipolaris sorokiniana ND90Pr]EMD63022.1 hypothetical protein COCSADRAFT_200645 [Bipolaris sorokiniana ND90Pr]